MREYSICVLNVIRGIFNKAEDYSSICLRCNVEMVYMGSEFISTEKEEKEKAKWNRIMSQPVSCPYCNSVNTSKISTTSKVINTAIFYYEYKCNIFPQYAKIKI